VTYPLVGNRPLAVPAIRVLRRAAELLAAVLFALMFAGFVIQIASRYVFNSPVAWSLEVCMMTYLWVVFWSSDILVRERQHIVFDVLYNWLGPRKRRVLAIFITLSLAATFLCALPGTYDYINYLGRRHSMLLHVPMQLVFGCFLIFVIAVVVSALRRLWLLLRPGWEEQL
jgi:TRAP-type C4-dicarboxylate transport system permease small subunit